MQCLHMCLRDSSTSSLHLDKVGSYSLEECLLDQGLSRQLCGLYSLHPFDFQHTVRPWMLGFESKADALFTPDESDSR